MKYAMMMDDDDDGDAGTIDFRYLDSFLHSSYYKLFIHLFILKNKK